MLRPYQSEIVGESAFAVSLQGFIQNAARSAAPLLLLGEAGTGKEAVARAIHFSSARRNTPFLMVDCSLYYERELERELFGYRPGPGEPPEAARQGLLELTPRGSCYAANVEELSPSIQLRILNLLDTGYLQPVGSDRPTSSRVRLIFSSEKNLKGFSDAGLFSEQLFRRFSGLTLRILPLRERPEDIGPLVRHFTAQFARHLQPPPGEELSIAQEALEALSSYPWPGNIAELKAEVGRILVAGNRRIVPEVLSSAILHHWLGRRGDPAVIRVLDEIQSHIQEFRVMSRLDAQYGDLLLDVADWDLSFKAHDR